MRCSATVSADDPCMQLPADRPTCATHGPATLAVDRQTGHWQWICTSPSPDPQEVPARANCSHGWLRARASILRGEDAPQQDRNNSYRGWAPPEMLVNPHRNSWLYVPFLLDAAGLLCAPESRAWREHPATTSWWADGVAILSATPAIYGSTLAGALSHVSGPRSRAEVILATLVGDSTAIDLPSAVRMFADQQGYLEPGTQDVLLQLFGGNDFARAVDAHSNGFREWQRQRRQVQLQAQDVPGEGQGDSSHSFLHDEAGDVVPLIFGTRSLHAAGGHAPDPTSTAFGADVQGLANTSTSVREGTGMDVDAADFGPAAARDTRAQPGEADAAETLVGEAVPNLDVSARRRLILTGMTEEEFAEAINAGSDGDDDLPDGTAGGGQGGVSAIADQHQQNASNPTVQEVPQVSLRSHLRASAFPASSWQALDEIDLGAELRRRVLCIQSPPAFLRGRLRVLYHSVLKELHAAYQMPGDAGALQQKRAWKLLVLMWRMILHRTASSGQTGKDELDSRRAKFEAGAWSDLLHACRSAAQRRGHQRRELDPQQALEQALDRATALIRQGALSKARQVLSSRGLAPGNATTLAELTDPVRRPPSPTMQMPPAAHDFRPAAPLTLNRRIWADCVRGAPKGSSSSLSGATFELLKLALDDEATLDLQATVAEQYAGGNIPTSIAQALGLGRMTALLKDNGRARGIVAGDAFKRLVGKCLSRQYGPEIESACAPYQYALSTRAGTDCASHFLRAATDSDPNATIVSIDGIGAFDHIRRARMIEKLMTLPTASALVPFVMLSYGQPSVYLWTDDSGTTHTITQGEGGEQGDPLMPALYALAQHGALEVARAQLLPGETLLAYLDDVYILCQPGRAVEAFRAVTTALQDFAGIDANLGKCRMWNRAGVAPAGHADLGADVWKGGAACRPADQGIVVLGSPVGSTEFVAAYTQQRMEDEQRFLQRTPSLPDLQCAWTCCCIAPCRVATTLCGPCHRVFPPRMHTRTTTLFSKRCTLSWPYLPMPPKRSGYSALVFCPSVSAGLVSDLLRGPRQALTGPLGLMRFLCCVRETRKQLAT